MYSSPPQATWLPPTPPPSLRDSARRGTRTQKCPHCRAFAEQGHCARWEVPQQQNLVQEHTGGVRKPSPSLRPARTALSVLSPGCTSRCAPTGVCGFQLRPGPLRKELLRQQSGRQRLTLQRREGCPHCRPPASLCLLPDFQPSLLTSSLTTPGGNHRTPEYPTTGAQSSDSQGATKIREEHLTIQENCK